MTWPIHDGEPAPKMRVHRVEDGEQQRVHPNGGNLPVTPPSNRPIYPCVSRSGVGRWYHVRDKDGACLFCDRRRKG